MVIKKIKDKIYSTVRYDAEEHLSGLSTYNAVSETVKKARKSLISGFIINFDGCLRAFHGTRTRDLLITNELLYQLS